MVGSVRVRRWDGASSEGRLAEAVMVTLVLLAFFVAFVVASFCRGSFMRLAAELEGPRLDSDVDGAVVVVVVEREALEVCVREVS